MMKKIFLVLITLLLLLTGCSKKESNQVSNENISTSIEEQEAENIVELTSYSFEEVELNFTQTYPVKINEENIQLINIHENLDNCELEICAVPKDKGLHGETILFSNTMQEPLLITQLYANDELENSENNQIKNNVIWSNETFSLVNLNTIIEEGNEELSKPIIENITNWIFDAKQAIGMLVTEEYMPSNADFLEISLDGLNGYVNVDYLIPSLEIETNRGGIYLPELSESGDAYIINFMYAGKDDIDYSNVIFKIIQIFNKQKTYNDAYFKINGEEYDFDLLKDYVVYENNDILVIDIMQFVYPSSSVEESLAAQFNGYKTVNDFIWANDVEKSINNDLKNFYE